MLIPTLSITPDYGLTLDQAQMVIDFETLMARLGLFYCLQCVRCFPRTDLTGDLVEAAISKQLGTYTLELACACSKRIYRGADLVVPKAPVYPDVAARLVRPEEKTAVDLSRPDMFTFDAMNQLLTKILKMRYWMRCMRCENESQNDGVYGQGESTTGTFIVECSCSRRVYAGHDAPAPVQ
jgi:hypothetical protein